MRFWKSIHQHFREHGKYAHGDSEQMAFYEENPYDYEEEIVNDMQEKRAPHGSFYTIPGGYALDHYVFDTEKIQDKSEYLDFAERVRRVNFSTPQLPIFERLLTLERYIHANPVRFDYKERECQEYMAKHGTLPL